MVRYRNRESIQSDWKRARVTLNAGSRLRWRADYGARTREVQLEGEGYFEVRHDGARPFRVHAPGAVAEDLGTRFTVRAYPEGSGVEVAVAEGRVALRALVDTTRVLLDAGAVLAFGSDWTVASVVSWASLICSWVSVVPRALIEMDSR